MRLYLYINSSLLLLVICALAKIPREQKTITLHEKKHIFFDLTNVLIKENQIEFAKTIGYSVLARYAITHFKSPGYRCLDMLDAMSKHTTQKPNLIITLKKRTLPRCLVELHEGKKTCMQVQKEIAQCIELLDTQKHFSSAKEKSLMINIMDIILNPTTTANMIEQVKPMVQLAEKLKSAGHTIYIFANAPSELYAAIEKKYPEIIQLFDNNVIISSQLKIAKPNPAIFKHLLTKYNLMPQNCILIDDLAETVAVAKKLGMQAFVYDKTSTVIRQLKGCGMKL
jgi:HAD superfamily hydrolase (TIGR01509 family)